MMYITDYCSQTLEFFSSTYINKLNTFKIGDKVTQQIKGCLVLKDSDAETWHLSSQVRNANGLKSV